MAVISGAGILFRLMAHYFARSNASNGYTFRDCTRVYLADIQQPESDDCCIAAIIGKNPGSACQTSNGVLFLAGDRMLPYVRNRFRSAFDVRGKTYGRCYVAVWNLFYLCNATLTEAISDYRFLLCRMGTPPFPICPTENTVPPIVWFAWGRSHPVLDQLKKRFFRLSAVHPVYFDNSTGNMERGIPSPSVCARHPQGTPAASVEACFVMIV